MPNPDIHLEASSFFKSQTNYNEFKKQALSVPRQFSLAQGTGLSYVSKLNSFDAALLDAKIDGGNFIQYSSIIPLEARYVKSIKLQPGSRTGSIFAKLKGERGDFLQTGIAIARLSNYYLVYESTTKNCNTKIGVTLTEQIIEAARIRKEEKFSLIIKANSLYVSQSFGCCFVAVIFEPKSYF